MASIFLSYAREDVAKAKALAAKLERIGHAVWWDRHIHGGSEFSDEIEAALKNSDVVLVVWSVTSAHSAWVRDEAAEGRDSGRLVPVILDDSVPPLGFRQLHSISIAGWSGRGNPPEFKAILAAIDARSAGSSAQPPPSPTPKPPRFSRPVLAGMIALAVLILGIGGWWQKNRSQAPTATPVLAVLPFSDLSPEGDKAYLAEGVAEAILTVLAKEPGIKIIGSSSARQLQDAGAKAGEMRRALGLTHVLEGSARSFGGELRMSVRLVNAADGTQVWTEEYHRPLANIFAVQDEIGRAVATKLRGSFGSALGAAPITKADNYALYLAARARIRDRRASSLQEALQLTKRVIAADPNYAPAHALYAEILNHLSVDNYGTIPDAEARRLAEWHARNAIAISPDLADGYAALGVVLENEQAIEPLKKAIALDPARAELRNWLGHALNATGRYEEAFDQFRAGLEMEPLWGPGISMVAYTLAASERHDEAEAAVALYHRRGGKASVATKIRGDIANYSGDYSEAARLSELALRQDPETPQADLSASWYYYLLGMYDDASRVSKRLPRHVQLAVAGKHDLVRQEARRAGKDIWKGPYPEAAIEAFAAVRDWETIESLYYANPRIALSMCADPEQLQMSLNIAAALRNVGRMEESGKILGCLRTRLTRNSRGSIRPPYLPVGALDLFWAQLRAIDGGGESLFPLLSRSIDRGVRTPYGKGLDDFPVLDGFKAHPDYAKLDARLKRLMARERAEALAWKRRVA